MYLASSSRLRPVLWFKLYLYYPNLCSLSSPLLLLSFSLIILSARVSSPELCVFFLLIDRNYRCVPSIITTNEIRLMMMHQIYFLQFILLIVRSGGRECFNLYVYDRGGEGKFPLAMP